MGGVFTGKGTMQMASEGNCAKGHWLSVVNRTSYPSTARRDDRPELELGRQD